MNYLQEWSSRSLGTSSYLAATTWLTSQTIIAAICLSLAILALSFLDAWPSTIKRSLWESLVFILPLQFIYGLELVMAKTRTGKINRPMFTREDLQNQHAKSEALQKIFGLDDNNFATTLQRVRTFSGLIPKQSQTGRPPGLGNWDNSCYQNSVIQGFASLPSFSSFIANSLKKFEEESEAPTMHVLKDFLGKLNDLSGNGKILWTPSTLKSMNSWQQQDAQEYFSRIIDEIEKEISRSKAPEAATPGLEVETRYQEQQISNRPLRRSPFEGLLVQRVGCKTCGYSEGLQLHPFNCLTLNLGMQSEYDITQCLDEYTTPENIEGVDCVKCTILRVRSQLQQLVSNLAAAPGPADHALKLKAAAETRLQTIDQVLDEDALSEPNLMKRCNISAKNQVSSIKTRQEVVARAPENLVVHINRSIFDMYGNKRKNTALVRFPLLLNLSRWCLGSRSSGDSGGAVESWTTNTSGSLLPLPNEGRLQPDKLYELRSVVTHYGRHENGHYVAYRKMLHDPSNADGHQTKSSGSWGEWYCFNDELVSPVSEGEVLSRGSVFMLFYEAIEAPHSLLPVPSGEIVDQPIAIEDPPERQEFSPSVNQVNGIEVSNRLRTYHRVDGDSLKLPPTTDESSQPSQSVEISATSSSNTTSESTSDSSFSPPRHPIARGVMRRSSVSPTSFLKDRNSNTFNIPRPSVVSAV